MYINKQNSTSAYQKYINMLLLLCNGSKLREMILDVFGNTT